MTNTMTRPVNITRDEAEDLVELLEDYDHEVCGTYRMDISEKIRAVFGMMTCAEADAEYKSWRKREDKARRNFTL
jgi:hypothetical protein